VIAAVAGIARASAAPDGAAGEGAYWDSEIKRRPGGRPAGLSGLYAKAATDVSYPGVRPGPLVGRAHLYGQFATHNAHNAGPVRLMASQMA